MVRCEPPAQRSILPSHRCSVDSQRLTSKLYGVDLCCVLNKDRLETVQQNAQNFERSREEMNFSMSKKRV